MELQASIYLEKLRFTTLNYTSYYTLNFSNTRFAL